MGTVSATQSSSNTFRQLSDGNDQGTTLGIAGTTAQGLPDKIGFWGAVTTQSFGAAQAAITRGLAFGCITTYATSQSPAVVGSNATSSQSITVQNGTGFRQQVTSGDLVVVNAASYTAGAGIGNVNVSATNVLGVSFNNFSSGSVTPAAGEKYGVVALRGLPSISQTLTPASVAAQTIVEQQFTVTGLRVGELVVVQKPTNQSNLDIVNARVVAANTLGITYANLQATTPIVPTAESYTIWSIGGLDAVNNTLEIQANVGATTLVASTTLAEVGYTVTGLAITDEIVGITKPTTQSGLGIVGSRVSGAGSLGVTYIAGTSTSVTPTSSEVYGVTVWRPNPAAPAIVYTASLAPASVAANTTAEQTFTVTGVVSGSMIAVNKPSFTTGIGIVGARVSGTNSIVINYANITSNAITPPTETYVIANFQQAIPDAGNSFTFGVSPQQQAASLLANAIRAAMVSMNQIAGS